jgi:hypothetical protein
MCSRGFHQQLESQFLSPVECSAFTAGADMQAFAGIAAKARLMLPYGLLQMN